MNERFKELAEQAGFELQYNCSPLTGEGEIYYAKEFEKFAELIIRECAMLVEGFELDQEVALDEYVTYEAAAVLKEHFGVEE